MTMSEIQKQFFNENEEAVCLLARAEDDYIAGRLLINEKMVRPGFCLIEQATEKYLKAWLCLDGKKYDKDHKLRKNVKLLKQNHHNIPEREWSDLLKRLEETWNAKYDEKFRPLAPISSTDLRPIDKMIYTIRKSIPLPKEIFDSLPISKLSKNPNPNRLWARYSDALFKDNKYFKLCPSSLSKH